MDRCRRFHVSGRVQGVGFRLAASAEAQRLGVTGWVRNLPSDDVEVLACGEADVLQEFERWLWQGPGAARVSAVVCSEAPFEDFADFGVR